MKKSLQDAIDIAKSNKEKSLLDEQTSNELRKRFNEWEQRGRELRSPVREALNSEAARNLNIDANAWIEYAKWWASEIQIDNPLIEIVSAIEKGEKDLGCDSEELMLLHLLKAAFTGDVEAIKQILLEVPNVRRRRNSFAEKLQSAEELAGLTVHLHLGNWRPPFHLKTKTNRIEDHPQYDFEKQKSLDYKNDKHSWPHLKAAHRRGELKYFDPKTIRDYAQATGQKAEGCKPGRPTKT